MKIKTEIIQQGEVNFNNAILNYVSSKDIHCISIDLASKYVKKAQIESIFKNKILPYYAISFIATKVTTNTNEEHKGIPTIVSFDDYLTDDWVFLGLINSGRYTYTFTLAQKRKFLMNED